jgi:hypothetical protein
MQKLKDHLKPLLFVVLVLFIAGGLFLFQKENTYDWIFIYYMSYDNDLSNVGERILRDLQKGIVNSKVVVLTQADFIDGKGMKRIALYRSFGRTKRKEIPLKSEDSADPNQLEKYFRWIRENWKANNYCIVFLNHGGRLNSMCLDEKPFLDQSKNKQLASGKWLPATEAGKIVANFNRMVGYKVRLLFLQQCGRATIQNLYSFTDAAESIMASPVVVGTPNTYYTKTIKSAADDPNITGTTLAKTIMQEDRDYTFYTLIDNKELKRFPEKLLPVLNCYTKNPHLNPPSSCPPIFEFKEEKFYDFKNYFQSLSAANNDIAREELQVFFGWCDNHLVINKAYKNSEDSAVSSYSGLSIYVPSDQNDIGRYNYLPLYQQTNLVNVLNLLVHK